MGGEGFALPAGTCSLMKPTIFFAIITLLWVQADATSRPSPSRANPYRAPRRLDAYAFSTCLKSSSTGVERPKIVTDTRSLLLS